MKKTSPSIVAWLKEGQLEMWDDIMYVLIGGDIRPSVVETELHWEKAIQKDGLFAVFFGTILAVEHIQAMSHRVDNCQNILGRCRRPACSTGSAGCTAP